MRVTLLNIHNQCEKGTHKIKQSLNAYVFCTDIVLELSNSKMFMQATGRPFVTLVATLYTVKLLYCYNNDPN